MSNYDHIPRPDVERHYHIKDLIEFQEKRAQDRNFYRDRQKLADDRESYITDAKMVVLTDFWCDKCKEDFKGQSVKQVETDWTNSLQNIAFYKNKCSKGHWCIRLITDRHKDGFFIKSKLMALDKGRHHNDTIQPDQTNFNLLYGKK